MRTSWTLMTMADTLISRESRAFQSTTIFVHTITYSQGHRNQILSFRTQKYNHAGKVNQSTYRGDPPR